MTTNFFTGGVPTEPDVKRLMVAFPSPEPGEVITHEQIAAIINVPYATPRYRSIVSAWRRRMFREQNIDTKSLTKVGFEILVPMDRVKESAKDFRRGTKAIRKSVVRIDAVPVHQLTQIEQATTEHVQRHIAATLAAAQGSVKAVTIRLGPGPSNPSAPFPQQTAAPMPSPIPRRR